MKLSGAFLWKRCIAIFVLSSIGCSPEIHRYIRFPDLAHPGPAAVQRAEAIQHDPYPLNDVAPEIVGGRPLAYQQGLTEEERARLTPPVRAVVTPVPVPGSAVTAPPVLASPLPIAPLQPGVPLVTAPPPIVTTPAPAPPAYPSTPPSPATSYPASTSPVVTSPYPAATPQPESFQTQQRASY